ncbi:MAG: hypothetical protein ABI688_12060 [Bacteroidota bacterium]
MIRHLKILILLIVLGTTGSNATTWDEPWAEKVIKEAGSFVLGKVISSDPEKGIEIVVLKMLGSDVIKDTIQITNFYSLHICSSSGGHGPEFRTRTIDSCYLFIKKNSKGQFCIATPTTGYDYAFEGMVTATFRHSYHRASVPVNIYEKAMTAVFNNYHGLSYDKDYMEKFVNEYLTRAPASFGAEEMNIFFLQHVALECVYHLKLDVKEALLLPFLNDKNNFHNQVSGARAMSAKNTEISKRELLKAIGDTANGNFVRVMCVWSLASFNAREIKAQVQEIEKTASDEREGFGGDIMDPRVCTRIPTLKNALKELSDKL